MWTRPKDDQDLELVHHCYICATTPNFDLEDDILARRKRIHRLNDLNQDAKAVCKGVADKEVTKIMRQRVGFAEFAYARDLILGQ